MQTTDQNTGAQSGSPSKADLQLYIGFNYIRQAFGPEKAVAPELQVRLELLGYKVSSRVLKRADYNAVLRSLDERASGKLSEREIDGPYLVTVDAKGNKQLQNMEQLVFLATRGVRRGMIADIARTAKRNPIGDRLKKLISEAYNARHSTDTQLKTALVAMVAAMRDDFEWQMLGLRQAISHRVNAAVDERLGLLMTPKPNNELLLATLGLNFPSYRDKLAEAAQRETKSRSGWPAKQVAETMEIGRFLPLCPDAGQGLVLDKVRLSNPAVRKKFNTLLSGAVKQGMPPEWFQAALIALRHPKYVQKNVWEQLWEKIMVLVAPDPTDSTSVQTMSKDQSLAAAHRKLLRHFFLYLEIQFPGADSNRVADLAFQLAGRLVKEFSFDPEFVKGFNKVAEHSLDHLKDIWVIASPLHSQSHLRDVLANTHNPWEALLIESFPTWAVSTPRKYIPDAVAERLAEIVRVYGIDFTRVHSAEGPEADHLLSKWAEFLEVDHLKQWASASVQLLKQYSGADSILEVLENHEKLEDLNSAVVISRFSQLMQEDQIDPDKLWLVITKPSFMSFVESVNDVYLDRFTYSFVSSSRIAVSEKRGQFAHWFAYATNKIDGNKERKALLFFTTVLLAMKTSSESAIVRVVNEDKRNALADSKKQMTSLFSDHFSDAPAWIRGRMRAALAAFTVTAPRAA